MDLEYIKMIYDILKLPTLEEKDKVLLTQFMEAYHHILNTYLNSEEPNNEITIKLQQLSAPVRIALNTPNDGLPHPAAEFIKQKEQQNGMAMEKSFTRVLKNPNAPSTIDEELQMNGFSLAIILIGITLILGIILGTLLFIITK